MPQPRASEVPGIHSQPPERAVVPPNVASFSAITTLSPRCAAVIAAAMPAAPEPTTSTSHSKPSMPPRSVPATPMRDAPVLPARARFGAATVSSARMPDNSRAETAPVLCRTIRGARDKNVDGRDVGAKQSFVASPGHDGECGKIDAKKLSRTHHSITVMPGLVPGIHVLAGGEERGWPGRRREAKLRRLARP